MVGLSARDAADAKAPEVLYLGGFGRSGSTLLERSVGELGDACAVGELVHLWERGLGNNELCGCGQPFRQCPFWTEVGEVAFGGWDALDADHVASLKHSVDRNRHFGRLLIGSRFGSFGRRLREYTALYDAIYRAVAQVSGARLVIDSSKHASLALCLRKGSGSRVRIAHVVRDSPAVVYSWTKVVARPEATGDTMARYTPGRAALWWDSYNLMFSLIGLTRIPLRRVRYEDFVRDPLETVRGLATWAGSASDPADYINADVVRLTAGHTVAGNPMRFRTGEIAIRRDQEWASAMAPGLQRRVRLWTLPFRWRYGYFKRRGADSQVTISTPLDRGTTREVNSREHSRHL
ncbi:MAG TPA: sulfotransferase [Frankiaceae bacterium]|nr:sulfotransferase [Frankiaceae bacterium]